MGIQDRAHRRLNRCAALGIGALACCLAGTAMAEDSPHTGRDAAETRHVGGIDNAWELAPLVLKDLQGVERNLYEWRGKVIVLNFWASWCAPCQIEIPGLVSYQDRYADQGLRIVSVGMDDPRKLANVARTLGINYPVLVADPKRDGALMREWGNRLGVLPFSVVIDRDGHLVFMRQGLFESEAFETWVLPLLERTPRGGAPEQADLRGEDAISVRGRPWSS